MKSKECKIKYVDEIDLDFKVNCAEISLYKYRIYGMSKKGWELLAIKDDKQKAIDYAKNSIEYTERMIIENDLKTDTDTPIYIERGE